MALFHSAFGPETDIDPLGEGQSHKILLHLVYDTWFSLFHWLGLSSLNILNSYHKKRKAESSKVFSKASPFILI